MDEEKIKSILNKYSPANDNKETKKEVEKLILNIENSNNVIIGDNNQLKLNTIKKQG